MNPLLWKIGGPILILLVIVGLFRYGQHWRDRAQTYNTEASKLVAGVQFVTGNPKMERKDAVAQLFLLKNAMDNLRGQLSDCSGRVDQLAAEGVRRQREADALLTGQIERRRLAESTSERLRRSALNPRADGKCLSEEVLKQWQ